MPCACCIFCSNCYVMNHAIQTVGSSLEPIHLKMYFMSRTSLSEYAFRSRANLSENRYVLVANKAVSKLFPKCCFLYFMLWMFSDIALCDCRLFYGEHLFYILFFLWYCRKGCLRTFCVYQFILIFLRICIIGRLKYFARSYSQSFLDCYGSSGASSTRLHAKPVCSS